MDVVAHFGLSQDPFATPEPDGLAGAALTLEAARAYLAGRIAGAGRPDLFTPAALDVLAEAAGGEPDLLRRLGGSALFHAAFEGAQRVEDQHARQAATTPDRPIPAAAPVRPTLAAATVTPVHRLRGDAAAAEAASPDPILVHRRWWRRTPPMTRLAIVVGALLLSLPIVGYTIGVVKDTQAASESSYLPANSINDQEKIAPAITATTVTVAASDIAAATLRPVASPLPAPTVARPATRPLPEPVPEAPPEVEAELELVTSTGLVVPEPSAPPPPEIETVSIDPPAAPVAPEETPQP